MFKERYLSSGENHHIYIIVLLIFLLITGIFASNLFVFMIQDGQTLSYHFLVPGEGFSLTYNHSVEKTPVVEIYKVKLNGGFIMDKTIFESYGAGLPLETRNFSSENGKFILDDMNIKIKDLRVRVSRTPGQIIKIGEKKYDLQEVSRPGELIILKSGTLYDLLKYLVASRL